MRHEPLNSLTDADPDEECWDGNAAAGLLAAVFADDVTSATAECAHCGQDAVLADSRVYTRAPGIILRCRGCGEVLMRMVELPTASLIDLHGLDRIALPRR
jgi:hypothetical protein